MCEGDFLAAWAAGRNKDFDYQTKLITYIMRLVVTGSQLSNFIKLIVPDTYEDKSAIFIDSWDGLVREIENEIRKVGQ